jgi:hypothetical protein
MPKPHSNVATFEISGISVPLPEGWYFHDEGASKLDLLVSLSEGAQTIAGRSLEVVTKHLTRYNVEVEGMDPEDAEQQAKQDALWKMGYGIRLKIDAFSDASVCGECLRYGPIDFGKGEETHVHLLYLDEGRQDVNLKIRAHEEQHAMRHIPGAIEALERKIEEDRGRPLHFDRIKDTELAADCNAVHALATRGFDLSEVYRYDAKRDSNVARRFKRATHIYHNDDYGYFGFAREKLGSTMKKLLKIGAR